MSAFPATLMVCKYQAACLLLTCPAPALGSSCPPSFLSEGAFMIEEMLFRKLYSFQRWGFDRWAVHFKWFGKWDNIGKREDSAPPIHHRRQKIHHPSLCNWGMDMVIIGCMNRQGSWKVRRVGGAEEPEIVGFWSEVEAWSRTVW